MARQINVYDDHLLSRVTNKEDQKVLLKVAEFQCNGCKRDALLEYENLTPASRSMPGISIYETRLLLMKGDFRTASCRLADMIGPNIDLATSPVDGLLLLLKSQCEVFSDLKLQEAVNTARHVRRVWLEFKDMESVTDIFVSRNYFVTLDLFTFIFQGC